MELHGGKEPWQLDETSASSVKKALDILTDKDLVYHSPEGYSIYDHFMRQWLCRL